MRVYLVRGVVGQLLRVFSWAFLPPVALAVWDEELPSILSFLFSALVTWLVGEWWSRDFVRPRVFYRAEAFAVVSGTWAAICVVAALPYVLAGLSPVDAIFESMSGLTTTGATILTDFSLYDRPFFLWRAMTQWFGGLGVIALSVVVLPRLGIAGRQLFFAESSSAPGEAVSPQVRQAASRLWVLYVAMTVACTALLMWQGMTLYESILHAFATLAAGGFSPNGESVAGYHNPGAEWVLVLFMFLSGASFPLQWKVYTGDVTGFFRDGEFLFYLFFTLLGTLIPAVVLTMDGAPMLEALRMGAFQSTSLISSTGFASVDYNLWPDPARAGLLVVMLIGGCAGSAAGGPKSVRHLLVAKHVQREITQALHPRAVLALRYKGRRIPPEVMRAVFTLVVLYVGWTTVTGMLLVMLGIDVISAFSAALACVGNIGPGFDLVGPMGNYSTFGVIGKLSLTVAMWVGRLEIITVLALLHPHVWRAIRMRPDEAH